MSMEQGERVTKVVSSPWSAVSQSTSPESPAASESSTRTNARGKTENTPHFGWLALGSHVRLPLVAFGSIRR